MDQKRPYLDLSDAIRAMFFIVDNDMFNNETYNIVTVNTTVREICKLVEEILPDIAIEYVDSRIMNQLSYTVANEKFRQAGFEFSGDLRTGILDTIRILGSSCGWEGKRSVYSRRV